MSAVNSLHLQRFPNPPRPLARPCDHGVHLGEHSRCQRRTAEKAVDADGRAEQELDEGVFHGQVYAVGVNVAVYLPTPFVTRNKSIFPAR